MYAFKLADALDHIIPVPGPRGKLGLPDGIEYV